MKIKEINAREILDSRGNPTVEVSITLDNNQKTKAAVPSGASTGSKEALELRDGDEQRYFGKGVLKACENVNNIIAPEVVGMDPEDQIEIDAKMLQIDGTENKSKLGANAILGVSLASARAAAYAKSIPLWKHIREVFDLKDSFSFPVPGFNVINGGGHADSKLDIQEFMVLPSGIERFEDRLRAGSEIYHSLQNVLKHQNYRIAIGDEGGFAPRLESNEAALQKIAEAIEKTSYVLGKHVMTGIDAAASEFYNEKEKTYNFDLEKKSLSASELSGIYEAWINSYHLETIEDPMSEFDWDGWIGFNASNKEKVTIVGDDLTVTNKKIIKQAYEKDACNSILIKVNQIGSLSETIESVKLTKQQKMKVFLSHRSGETVDDFIADLAFAVGAEYVKFGATTRAERVSKYNRLWEIEKNEI